MKTYFFTIILAFFLLSSSFSQAQKQKKKFKKVSLAELNDSLTSYSQSDIFLFPNLNEIPFYHDAAMLKKIGQLQESSSDEKELYEALREYVKHFGVKNFQENTAMVWQLARLSEKHGHPGEAVLLYKMVLKHHKNINTKKVQQEFDTLTRNEKDYYVPLEHYYELVEYRKEIDTLRPPQGVLLRMDDWVNSPKADYGPAIGRLDSVLLFTSKRNTHARSFEKRFDEDIFFTTRSGEFWSEAQEFKTINTRYNEGSACISRDGKRLYFARCNSPDSHGNCDIFEAELTADSTWGNVKNLGTVINTTSWDSHPSLSHSGDTLFFASDRIGGFGMTDIYYSMKDKKTGVWQQAQNIGPTINTRGSEVSPFFHQKYNVLYFSSDGQPLTFGDFDIYKSYLRDDTWGEPKNIGPLVNGPGSEYYFTIDSESNRLYYARSEKSDVENLDLHTFPVPMEAKPDAVARLKGSLIDGQTKKPFTGIVSVIDLDHGVEVAPKFLRPDGSFDFDLINKRNYLLIIQGEDFFRIEEIFFLDGYAEINREAEPIEPKIAFESLEFENGKADILVSMHEDLDKLANFLIDHPRFALNISGHTDSQGKEEANLELSQARADAIRNYLVTQFKIDGARISARGYGSSNPIVKEETDADRKLNRRVEFEIVRNQ